jgi:hypothetical protein
MYILEQLLIYFCESKGWVNSIYNIKNKTEHGKNIIRLYLYNDLRRK